MMIRRKDDIAPLPFSECHEGRGTLYCSSLLDGFESGSFMLMHSDTLAAGVSIGIHEHTTNEEIYYLLSGSGILTFDGEETEMRAGDISLCGIGHSHGFLAREDCLLIVVGSK